MVRWLAVVVVALSVSSCRVHLADDGRYAFSLKPSDVLRDDCGLAADSAVVSTGVLRSIGNVVELDYGYLDIKLVGTYLDKLEQMTFDGTAVNVSTQVRGQLCLLDTVAIHLDAKTLDANHFSGAMKIVLDARSPDGCVCQLWFRYEASRTGP